VQKIFTASQFRELDAYTIEHEPIASIDLMERAASLCFDRLMEDLGTDLPYLVVCGTGNNGGDGLVIARLLAKAHAKVQVFIAGDPKSGTADFKVNLECLGHTDATILDEFPNQCELDAVIVDAIFGNGLSRPAGGLFATVIEKANELNAVRISIDLPSGLPADPDTFDVYDPQNAIIRADRTYTFDSYKKSLLLDDLEPYFGKVEILDIGLDVAYRDSLDSDMFSIEISDGKRRLSQRLTSGYKGNFGHALLISGQKNMMGATLLASTACLRSGVGLLTVHCPADGQLALQTGLQEAMTLPSSNSDNVDPKDIDTAKYTAIGLGCGIGKDAQMSRCLIQFLQTSLLTGKPHVIDADALNILSDYDEMEQLLQNTNTVLTPHPKEFDRLFGAHGNRYERIQKARYKAQELNIHILLKGARSVLLAPSGESYYFPFPNSGMAKGGSGDVLSGIILSMLAQGYESTNAVIISVCAQASSGYAMREKYGERVMLPGDVAEALSGFFV